MIAFLADRLPPALFLLAAAALLASRMGAPRARRAWIALIALGLAYDLALNLQPANFPQSNFAHYYLGAKYPVPYGETYRLIHAGQGRPQVGMRDLDQPAELVRATVPEQRAYYLGLLHDARVPADSMAPLDALAARARASGAVEAEARRILAERLPAHRIPEYRRDVRAMLAMGQGPHVTLDYGYNGSPFYGLIRQLDPTLHLAYGRIPALAGLAWSLLGVALIAALAGPALGLAPVERVAVAGLILVSPEFTRFAMPGLVFTELWVPILLALWALRRGRFALAGIAIAVAGLLKLFPFVLAVASAVPWLGSLRADGREAGTAGPRRRGVALLASCAVGAVALSALSLASGRTWTDYLHKVGVEFQSGWNLINSVSLAAGLAVLGVPDHSPLHALLSLASLAVLALLFWRIPAKEQNEALARRGLVLLAALGWVAKGWLNYYAIAPLVLLPWVARRRRGIAAAIVASLGAACLLPDFGDPALVQSPTAHFLKLLPFVTTPAVLVGLELHPSRWRPRTRRIAALAVGLLVLATAAEAWRGHEIRRLAREGEAALGSGDTGTALLDYGRLVRLSPADATAQRKRAIALAMGGRLDEALGGFARAVALDPGSAAARDDYARALLMRGRLNEAAAQLETAIAQSPSDVQVLYQLASVRAAQGRRAEAIELLSRARALAPDEPAIPQAIERLQSP